MMRVAKREKLEPTQRLRLNAGIFARKGYGVFETTGEKMREH